MAEAFKELLNAQVLRQVGEHFERVWPSFPRARFEAHALHQLDTLEFKARALQLARALGAALPADFHRATDILDASLKAVPPPQYEHDPDTELGGLATDHSGLGGWPLWGLGEFVATHGLAHPERALRSLHALTQRFTAEFAIRPFLIHHPELTLRTLHQWVDDPSAHVRRLVSEGSRPRLPWGLRLHALVANPAPTLPLLTRLQDDPSEYVRRSVANHLNDIAKDHPDVLLGWLHAHLPDAPPHRARMLRHASRTLIKQGHPDVLSAWGRGQAFQGRITLELPRATVHVGESLELRITLRPEAEHPQELELDLRVHYLKADGRLTPKVFKGRQLTLAPAMPWTWTKRLAFKPITTRTLYPGTHQLDVQINGQTHASASFNLLA